jgi:cell division protein FtsZ
VIINVTGGSDLSLIEVSEASAIIQEAAHEDANIIFGAVVDPKMEGRVKITVIATGFDRAAAVRQASASSAVTPVDLHSYTAFQATEKLAASGGGSRLTVSRRSLLEMPLSAPAAIAGPAVDPLSPGAEFEPVSPLDIPAFLRRQQEG